jgi:hypothetical protein
MRLRHQDVIAYKSHTSIRLTLPLEDNGMQIQPNVALIRIC